VAAKPGNRQVPDDVIKNSVATTGEEWNLGTEIFVLLKTAPGSVEWARVLTLDRH
jgi:hypothetical protein